jgi:hypothetical protein
MSASSRFAPAVFFKNSMIFHRNPRWEASAARILAIPFRRHSGRHANPESRCSFSACSRIPESRAMARVNALMARRRYDNGEFLSSLCAFRHIPQDFHLALDVA